MLQTSFHNMDTKNVVLMALIRSIQAFSAVIAWIAIGFIMYSGMLCYLFQYLANIKICMTVVPNRTRHKLSSTASPNPC